MTLPNVGREGHSYAYHIEKNYKYVLESKESNGSDIVMFLKDNGIDRHMRKNPIDLVLSNALGSGFGCVSVGVFDNCPYVKKIWTMQHMREELLETLELKDYQEKDRDSNEAFKTDKYTSFKHWAEEMKIIIPASETMPVCYGGHFAAQKKQFLNQPEEVWHNIVESLSRADNLIEGHYAERTWATIL